MFHLIHQSSNSLSILYALQLHSSPHFLSGLAKDPSCKPYQEHGRVTSCRWNSTTASGPQATWVIDLLAPGGMKLTLASKGNVILPPKLYTSTLMAPPPPTVSIVGITSSLPVASVSVGGSKATVSDSQEMTPPSIVIPKHCQIALASIQSPKSPILSSSSSSPGPSSKSPSYPTLVVPDLTKPAEAQPKRPNEPGGGKEYWYQLCTSCHSNLDCILTHIKKHLDFTIGCLFCGK